MPRLTRSQRSTRQQADEAYEIALRQEARLLKQNIAYFKTLFDRDHMKDLSAAAKARELPAWRQLQEQVAPFARRLCVIEWYLENKGQPIPLHK